MRKSLSEIVRRKAARVHQNKYGYVCYYCGCDLHEYPVHLDHVIPVSQGGTDDVENLVLSCCFCNMAKMDVSVSELLRWFAHIKSSDFKSLALKDYWDSTILTGAEIDRLS